MTTTSPRTGISAEPFQLSSSVILVNILWFCSLLIVLACALLATLVQQWSRDYTRDIRRRDVLDESLVSRAYNHVHIRMGVDRYGMDEVVNLLVALVHLSVILFATGLLLFLFPINLAVVWCAVVVICILGLVYFAASLFSIFDTSCPYRTPLTYPLFVGNWSLGRVSHVINGLLRQRDFSPLVEVLFEWCCDVLPAPSTQLVPRRHTVYSPLEDDTFLSVLRFELAWLHTSRQMFDTDFKTLLQFVMTKLASMPEELREECLHHLESDEQLKSRFRPIGSYWPGSMDYEADVVGYQMCCALFQRFYDDYRQAGLYERDRVTLNRYLQTIISGATTSSITTHSAMLTLQTRFSLFYLRWYLLLVLLDTVDDGDVLGRNATQILSYIFQDYGRSDSHAMRVTGEEIGVRSNYWIIDRPWTLLYLVNSLQVSSMDASGYKEHCDLEEDVRSCLVPLHDNACCRRSDMMSHAAACNVLTMIAHLLRAPEGDRMDLLRHRHEYDRLFNHGNSPFVEWLDLYDVKGEERRIAPSPEFAIILRDARLGEWLDPGSDFTSSPLLGTSQGRLLHQRVSDGYLKDNACSPPSPICTLIDVLRALARRVNFNVNRVSETTEQPPDPHSHPGVAATVRDVGSFNASTSASSSSPDVVPSALPTTPEQVYGLAPQSHDSLNVVSGPSQSLKEGNMSPQGVTSQTTVDSTTTSTPTPVQILPAVPSDDLSREPSQNMLTSTEVTQDLMGSGKRSRESSMMRLESPRDYSWHYAQTMVGTPVLSPMLSQEVPSPPPDSRIHLAPSVAELEVKSAGPMRHTSGEVQYSLHVQAGVASSPTPDIQQESSMTEISRDVRSRRQGRSSPRRITEEDIQRMAEWQHSFGTRWETMTGHERWEPFHKQVLIHHLKRVYHRLTTPPAQFSL